MSNGIILSDNHKETGILYHIYELHKDADKFLHLGILNLVIMTQNLVCISV